MRNQKNASKKGKNPFEQLAPFDSQNGRLSVDNVVNMMSQLGLNEQGLSLQDQIEKLKGMSDLEVQGVLQRQSLSTL